MNFHIRIESALSDDVRALVAALNETTLALTPAEHTHHMSVEQMAQPDTTVLVAREDGGAVAMGALRRHASGIAEVKRMYTMPSHQGRGLGGAILQRIEALAREEGFSRLLLETGSAEGFAAAWRVYERHGFARCGAFLDYPVDSPHNIYYEKLLSR